MNGTMKTTYTSECISWEITRGFGWLANPDPAGRDIFVHRSGLVDRHRLITGEIVAFELKSMPKGPVAVNVRVLKSKADGVIAMSEVMEAKEATNATTQRS